MSKLALRTLDQLAIDDERSFHRVALYGDLKRTLERAKYRFRVMDKPNWDRALLLNLTYWNPESGGDVLVGETISADVVTHVAWHHLAALALSPTKSGLSASAMFLGESIASAFDLYLVGRLLTDAPRSSFLATQVPAMSEVAQNAGLGAKAFEALLLRIARSPDRAFADLRTLLFDATTALHESRDAKSALTALGKFDRHPLAPLLHHYELSNWVLYARAYGKKGVDRKVAVVDRALRKSDALMWLTRQWLSQP